MGLARRDGTGLIGVMALAGLLLGACSEAPTAGAAEPVDIAALSRAIDGSQDLEPMEALSEPMGPPIQAALNFMGPSLAPLATTRTRNASGKKAAPTEIKTDSDGRLVIGFPHLSLDELDDIQLEDLLDALLYPDEYEEEDRRFPEQIQALDGKEVALTGFMIPVVWEETKVEEFMLVRDLLACCFGGAPQPGYRQSLRNREQRTRTRMRTRIG